MKKNYTEEKRQLFHLLLGFIIALLYITKILTIKTLMVIFVIGIITSLLSYKYKLPLVYWFLKNFEREKDLKENPGKGTLAYIGGVLLSLILFEENIALAAIMVLAVGDSVSHMVGKYFGKRKYSIGSPKHLEGTAAGIFFASIAASMFVTPRLAFLGSIAGMLVESVELKIGKMIIDDNLTIPLAVGLTIYLLNLL